MATKTDNHNQAAKLDLRRHFMASYHQDGQADVIDCCQAGGFLWTALRQEFPIARYTGLDVRQRKGRLQIESSRYLQAGGWSHNVIDVDTYGSPWRHWMRLLPNVTAPTTVFLTIGLVRVAGCGALQTETLQALGVPPKTPRSILGSLAGLGVRYCLAAVHDFGLTVVECCEAENHGNARYIGVRIAPSKHV